MIILNKLEFFYVSMNYSALLLTAVLMAPQLTRTPSERIVMKLEGESFIFRKTTPGGLCTLVFDLKNYPEVPPRESENHHLMNLYNFAGYVHSCLGGRLPSDSSSLDRRLMRIFDPKANTLSVYAPFVSQSL